MNFNKSRSELTRRKLIKSAAMAGLGGAILPVTTSFGITEKEKLPLLKRRMSAGTLEWQLFTGFDTPVTMASIHDKISPFTGFIEDCIKNQCPSRRGK